MEPAEAWGRPSELQLANHHWSNEEPAAADEIWAPAAGQPVEYASMDIFGSCYYYTPQAYVPQSIGVGGQQQAVQPYYYSSAASPHCSSSLTTDHEVVIYMDRQQNRLVTTENSASNKQQVVDSLKNEEMDDDDDSRVRCVVKQVERAYRADINLMKYKMHRYPASHLANLNGKSYTLPKFVAIGPYHHDLAKLKKAEKDKHMAAICCVRESGRSLQEIYDAVASVADDVRCLYDKDLMAGISCVDFRDMMFVDACFLVQYMIRFSMGASSDKRMDPSLGILFDSHKKAIHHDVWLLENQLPWRVVETVMMFRKVPLKQFVARWWLKRDFLQDRYSRKVENEKLSDWDWDGSYKPAHLLDLLRHYIVGSGHITEPPPNSVDKIDSVSFSVSAIELAEIGITLTANETTTELINMGLSKKVMFLAELSLTPLSLDDTRASRLVNMAALELCTTPSFMDAGFQDSAVCSYLLLLSMLVHREEDVHELRTKGILQGGGGLTNKEALDFFTNLQSLPRGLCYKKTMLEIDSYRVERRMQTRAHAFIYKKKKSLCTVLSTIVAVVSILGTLVGILVKLKSLN